MESARCKAFLYAVETGSFSGAAKILNYTPSGVSQLVTALESELGISLLHRNRKGVLPTASGESLLPAVREFLQQENRIFQLASQMNDLLVGSVTIAAYSSIASHWLPSVIRAFQKDYPQIQIHLMEGIRQDVTQWLDEKKADFGLISYQTSMPYDWIPLADDPMLAVLPKDHPLATQTAYPLENCAKEQFIMPALGRDTDVISLFEDHNLSTNIRFSTIGNFATLAMIEQGLGMSIMNGLITRNWQCDVVMLPLDPPQKITLGIAIPSLKNAPPAVKRFVEYAVIQLTRRDSEV